MVKNKQLNITLKALKKRRRRPPSLSNVSRSPLPFILLHLKELFNSGFIHLPLYLSPPPTLFLFLSGVLTLLEMQGEQ